MDHIFKEKIKKLVNEAKHLEKERKERIEAARSRFEAVRNQEIPDRIPVTINIGPVWSDWYFKKKYHLKIGKYWKNPELLIEYQLRVWIDSFKDFEDDRTSVIPEPIGPLGGVVLHPSIVGCKIFFPEDDFAWIDLRHKTLDTKEKIDDFMTPDIPKAGLMPETLEKAEKIRNIVEDICEVGILGGDGAPLQLAAYTRGITQLVRDMYTDPPIVHKLMTKMTEVYNNIYEFYQIHWCKRHSNSEAYFYDNPLSYFAPYQLEKFVLPYYREIAQKRGWKNWSFETQDIMDQFIHLFQTIPIKAIHNLVSSSNLTKFKEKLDSKQVLYNVFLAPGKLMLDINEIEEEVKRIIKVMGYNGGWTLSSGTVDSAISRKNIQAFLKAVRKHGRCR